MNERDIRAIESMARTGMNFDDLRKSFKQFPIEDVERIYMRIRKEKIGKTESDTTKINCS